MASGGGSRTAAAVAEWLTTGDQSSLLAPQPVLHLGAAASPGAQTIAVDDATRYQTLTGFGAALTDSAAWLLSRLPADTRTSTLNRLFAAGAGSSGGVGASGGGGAGGRGGPGPLTVVRVPLGSSDFVVGRHYSYDDLPSDAAPGATDPTLSRFSIARDEAYLIPLLRDIRALNPAVRIVASPWSAPGWMKTSGSLVGGTLDGAWSDAYARYLVLTLKAFAADGVPVDALTVQNEPEFSPGDYPGMTLTEPQEAELIAHHLGPELVASGLNVALLGYDHNWEDPTFPASLLANRPSAKYLAGVAFHCNAGDVSAQTKIHNAAPHAAIWLSECSGGSWSAGFAADLVWETRNLFVGGTRNWATAVLWFNLALDPGGGPHNGGCTQCRGMLTVDPATGSVTDNVEYWSLAHAALGAHPGGVRVASSTFGNGNLESTAFRNLDGSHALVVVNSGTTPRTLQIQTRTRTTPATLPGGAVATFIW
jgi:glucosylceramidase